MCTVRQKRLSSTHTHVRACLITLLGTVWPCQSRMLGEFGRLVLCSESWELCDARAKERNWPAWLGERVTYGFSSLSILSLVDMHCI